MSTELPDDAYASALAALPWLGPELLGLLLRRWCPAEAWEAVRAGRAVEAWSLTESPAVSPKRSRGLASAARRIDPERLWQRAVALGVATHRWGTPGYPPLLADDLLAPPVLFSLGSLGALDGRRVTIVGTRNASATGREVAAELGRGLAEQGVRVVSGLARGIDGWAHRGALAAADGAPPIGVVASGLDVVYPPEHRQLWRDVAERGVLLSEAPPGVAPHAYRFPLRNRILAALGEVVVVVESRATGGSLHTVDEATARGVAVLAVPGSPRSPSAEGTNQLLLDGATPVVCSGDVLGWLGFTRAEERRTATSPGPGPEPRGPLDEADRWALDLVGDGRDVDALVQLSGRSLVEVVGALTRLEEAGWVERRAGRFHPLGQRSARASAGRTR